MELPANHDPHTSGWADVLNECFEDSGHAAQADAPNVNIPKRGGRTKVGSKLLRDHVKSLSGSSSSYNLNQLQEEPGQLQGIAYARQCRENALAKKKHEAKQSIAPIAGDESNLSKFGPSESLLVVGSPLQKTLGAVIQKILQCRIDLNDEVLDQTLSGKTLTSSSRAVGGIMNKTQKHVQNKLIRAGAGICETGNWLWGNFLSLLLQSGYEPLLITLKLRYDETPTRVRVVDSPTDGHIFAPRTKSGVAWLDQLMQSMVTLPKGPDHESQPATHAKILQTEMQIGVLLKQSDRFLWIHGPVPTCLQATDHLTGETTRAMIWASISSVPELSRILQGFPMQVRLTCTDKAGCNFRCEAGLCEEGYMPGVTSCHVPCDVHRLSTSIGISNRSLETDVSGVLNCGLVLNEVGIIRRLREMLLDIFDDELTIVNTFPPNDAHERRCAVYDMFLPINGVSTSYKKSNLKRRKILSTFLNGTLLEEQCTHYCVDCCSSEEETLASAKAFLVWSLLPFNMPIYSRKSWVGQDFSLDWIGCLEAHHRLFSRLVEKIVGKVQPGIPSSKSALPSTTEESTAGWMAAIQDELENKQRQPAPSLTNQQDGPV